jgi:hypothetical protein
MSAVPLLTNCPPSSQAPWASYVPGPMSGQINVWVR